MKVNEETALWREFMVYGDMMGECFERDGAGNIIGLRDGVRACALMDEMQKVSAQIDAYYRKAGGVWL